MDVAKKYISPRRSRIGGRLIGPPLFGVTPFRITVDQHRRFLQKVAGINPIKPKAGACLAAIQTALEFFVNQLLPLGQFGAGFASLAKLIARHRRNGMDDGIATWKSII